MLFQMIRPLLFLIFFASALDLKGQFLDQKVYANRVNEAVIPDGILDEQIWKTTPRTDNFLQNFPSDSVKAKGETYLQMAYDDKYLYVAVISYSLSNDFLVTSLRRDYSFQNNDNITLVIDTYGDQNNAFVFGLNALGVRREALISNGGRSGRNFIDSWDNKWNGGSKIYTNYWVSEFTIPFSTLRFENGSDNWRFNCYRSDTQMNEISTLNRVPRNRIIMDLTYSSPIQWEDLPKGNGSNISVIPYVGGNISRDFENVDQSRNMVDFDLGGDAKIAITSGLNLDLTANPDFSQVEVDQQVTNLGRFELFFPERRQFFLENADLFSEFGVQRTNPFFSRRIGIVTDTATGINIQNPIYFGARLSGKLNDNLRVGLLNMHTARDLKNGLPSFNYTVATMQHQVFGRSNISAILVNKQAVNPANFQGEFNSINRIGGIEYRLASASNKWQGKFLYHHAFAENPQPMPYFHLANLEYQVKKYKLGWTHQLVGQGFDAEVGFVPRKDFFMMGPEAALYFYPNGKRINQHNIFFNTQFFHQIGKDGNQILNSWSGSEQNYNIQWEVSFKNNTRFNMGLEHTQLVLLDDFDPTRVQEDDVFLRAGNRYSYSEISASYTSDRRQKIYFRINPSGGSFFDGKRIGSRTSLTYQFQPYGSIALDVNYNYVQLAAPFQPASIWLVGPKLDITFTKNIYLTTFVQYNNQQENLNINARFQWRYAPVSDLFIVYTDNYLTNDFSQFSVRNRALVAKITYWLNL